MNTMLAIILGAAWGLAVGSIIVGTFLWAMSLEDSLNKKD